MKRRFSIFILILVITAGLFGGLFFNDNVWAQQTTGVNLTVRIVICGDGITHLPEEECDPGPPPDLAGQSCLNLGYDGGTLVCRTNCTLDTSNCFYKEKPPPPPPGGDGRPTPSPTKVILLGKAYPLSTVNVLIDGKVVTNVKADSLANFKAEIINITPGVYTFSLWAEDKAKRKSITFSFTATVLKDVITTVSGIFIPPTIELDKVNVLKGEDLTFMGTTAPESEVTIHISSPEEIVKKTIAQKDGDWKYIFDTLVLKEGSHTVRAKAKEPTGLVSIFSNVLSFYVGKYGIEEVCPKADFNKDGRTDLIDFSIMLYWWGKYNPCVDQNRDGIVNLPDFSILMYWWTG